MQFSSTCQHIGGVSLPQFQGHHIMMLPVILGDCGTVAHLGVYWQRTFKQLCALWPKHTGQVGYLTLDEKLVKAAATHRRRGLHVDGVFRGAAGSWGGGSWGGIGNGMVTVSNVPGCRAFPQDFVGCPGPEGECDHLADQTKNPVTFGAGQVYWVDGLCVHESLPQAADVKRQFVRLSMPSHGPWFEGYTESPIGIKPTGPILPRREFMNS